MISVPAKIAERYGRGPLCPGRAGEVFFWKTSYR
jgi:hypothetical protein